MPVLDLDLLHVRIVAQGRASLWPWWHLRQRSTPGWVLYADDRDGARLVVAGRAHPLRAGRVTVIPPDTVFDSIPGPDVHQVYFHVDLLGLPASTAAELLPAPLDLGADPILAAQAARLHALMPDMRLPQPPEPPPPSLPLLGLAFVHQAFARLLECSPRARRVAWSARLRAHGPLSPALRHIDDHIGEPLYAAGLAGMCRMGPQWFTARFRAAVGLTPAQYILERRTAVAAQRLAFSDESIEDIATACGFADRSHFTRIFTRRRGIAPAAYRRREQLRFLA